MSEIQITISPKSGKHGSLKEYLLHLELIELQAGAGLNWDTNLPQINLSATETLRAACFTPFHSHCAPACNHACNNIVATDSITSGNGALKQVGNSSEPFGCSVRRGTDGNKNDSRPCLRRCRWGRAGEQF